MKVSTDAVLLGSWAEVASAGRILDVGTGCGIIALMTAQRSLARIDAIDPDEASVAEAAENFANSPWRDRLEAQQVLIQTWEVAEAYDHILCNPPYFLDQLPPPCHRRNRASHAQTLPPPSLAAHIARLLHPEGHASLVCVASVFDAFRDAMKKFGYQTFRICSIRNTDKSAPKLVLASYSKGAVKTIQMEELVLHNPDGSRSPAYDSLTKDFYL